MTFLLANWRILGVTAVIALFGLFLWHYDALSDRAAEADMLEDELKAVVIAQEKTNAALLAYETTLQAERAKTEQLKGDLADAIKHDPVAFSCTVPSLGVQSYNKALSRTK